MLVYHGTNTDIEEIDLTKGSRFKDFGQGFYVTPDLETARRMARKKVDLFKKGKPTVISYELDESVLTSAGFNILIFPEKASVEWIKFISSNRNRRSLTHTSNFDVVQGPIADDGVALQLARLRNHEKDAEQIAIDLQDKYFDQQLCLRTQRSLSYIKKISVCELK